MNKYVKFAPNVFVAQCEESHQKGDIIIVTTKHGREHECEIVNDLGGKRYSIVRTDGENYQTYCKRKAEKRRDWAISSAKKSSEKIEQSNEGKEFLSLAEPIKVGHHSEGRHRALIERNHNRMAKAVELSNKADEHKAKADYWDSRANEINLSMPESIDYYQFELDKAKKYHAGLKSGKYPKVHAYSVAYANKKVKDLAKHLNLATRMWG